MSAIEIEGYRIGEAVPSASGVQLFRASQLVNESPVLLQLWQGDAAAARQSIRHLAGLRHPGLATVLDLGELADGRAYAALGCGKHTSLRTLLGDGLDLQQSLSLLRRIALVLQFLESRTELRPELAAEDVLIDPQGRPAFTRLSSPTSGEPHSRSDAVRALALFYEALTGHPTSSARVTLPEYLSHWQALFDLADSNPSIGAGSLLQTLDRLEGRPSSPRSEPPRPAEAEVLPAPTSDVASTRGQSPAPSAPPHTGRDTAQSQPKREEPGVGKSRRPAVAGLSPDAGVRPTPHRPRVEPVPAEDSERVTAPSKRTDFESAKVRKPRAAPPLDAPAPPSRLPLWMAAGLALPLLLGVLLWVLFGGATEQGPSLASAPPSAAAAPVAVSADGAEPGGHADANVRDGEGFAPPDPAADWTPLAPFELDLAALPTVEDPLERLLQMARLNVEAGRLVQPPGRNALDRYLQALQIESGNRSALQGLQALAARCLEDARRATELGAKRVALDCVLQISEAHPAARDIAAEAYRYRLAEHDKVLEQARSALSAWQAAQASTLFQQALSLVPDSLAAAAGLEEARRIGRPGYRFRDVLSGGGVAPDMRVVGRLAWGITEVRVDEFEAYWNASGRARFGTELPACRDRESMLRSSRKRSWRAPDIEQGPDHPVVCVNFAMAQHYAQWLSEATGQTYRLPRLEEWRVLAGTPPAACTANLRDQSAARAWSARDAAACDDAYAFTAPVTKGGGAAAELLGIWGNAAEWLSDCDAGNCRERLAAGGSWFSSADEIQPRGFAAEPAFTTIGFRVVREIPAL